MTTDQDSLSHFPKDLKSSYPSRTCSGSIAQAQSIASTKLVVDDTRKSKIPEAPHPKPADPDCRDVAHDQEEHESNSLPLANGTKIYTSETIQGFGLLFVLQNTSTSNNILVQAVSENSTRFVGKTPSELLSLEDFTSIIKETYVNEFVEHIDHIQSTDNVTNKLEAFTVAISTSADRFQEFWCVMHQSHSPSDSVICEFELREDERTAEPHSQPPRGSPGDTKVGTSPLQKPDQSMKQRKQQSRDRCSGKKVVRKIKSGPVVMDTLDTLARVQDRLATAPDLASLLQVAVDIVKELTGYHRVMIYQFDKDLNARVVAERADAEAAAVTYLGRTFAASEFNAESGEMHEITKLRILHDRDIGSARLVCSASSAFDRPLSLTYSYLRAMSNDRLKFLANLAVRSSVSISLSSFNRLWGLVMCYSHGVSGIRLPFPVRRICYLLSDMVSTNIERFSYASQLRAKQLINTLPTSRDPTGRLGTSLMPLLKLLRADSGILYVRDTTQVFGSVAQTQAALVVLEYLRLKPVTSVLISTNVQKDFSDLHCPFDLSSVGGVLVVPLSNSPKDFVAFFRNPQPKELGKEAGASRDRTGCQDWTEDEIEVASIFAYVYSRLIAIWGHDEAALKSSRLSQLLLANAAHEIRTPLNAVINYLELALEGPMDEGIRQKLQESQHVSKSLLRFVHELLSLINGHSLRR